MEESLLKTSFIGRDGFLWWIGQVASETSWNSNSKDGGWGVRYKVRIMGYHPPSTAELKDEDLPWAQVMLPPGSTGGAMIGRTIKFAQGDVVVGFFLDGDNAQIPVIMGAFGKTTYAAPTAEQIPFGVNSGFSDSFKKKPSSVIKNDESNQSTPDSRPSPTKRGVAQAKRTNPDNPATYTSTDGYTIPLPCGNEEEKNKGSKGTINKVKIAIEQFVKWLQDKKAKFDEDIEWLRDEIDKEIDERAEQITKILSGLISGMVNTVMASLASLFNKGMKMLYAKVYAEVLAATGNPIAAHLAGVAAQLGMVPALKTFQCLIECLTNQIVGKVTSLIAEILKSVANNVLNFAQCIADQTVGAMINGIISLLDNAVLPALQGVTKILSFFEDFNFQNLLRNSIDAILGLVGLRSCFKPPVKDKYGACKYVLGYGPVMQDEPDLDGLIKNANVAKAASVAAQVSGFPLDGVQDIVGSFGFFSDTIKDPASEFLGDVDSCFAGIPTLCGPPKINIFGGGGEGGAATALMGLIDGEGRNRTGSVIDIQVTNPGNGYTFPPFVEVVDSCGKGYGCVARSIVKDGKLTNIYVVSEGEGYPVEDDTPYIVDTVTVIDPGSDYEDGDIVTDNLGNEYEVEIYLGAIIKVTPINSKDITAIPTIEVISDTGSGAILSANLGARPDQREVKQVIDCVI